MKNNSKLILCFYFPDPTCPLPPADEIGARAHGAERFTREVGVVQPSVLIGLKGVDLPRS